MCPVLSASVKWVTAPKDLMEETGTEGNMPEININDI